MQKKKHTYSYLDIPPAIITLIFSLGVIFFIAPYLPGQDFGIFKIPQFPPDIIKVLKIIGPIFLSILIIGFIPFWTERTPHQPETKFPNSKRSKASFAEGNYVYVQLFGNLIGTAFWDKDINLGSFQYERSFLKKGIEPSPIIMPTDDNVERFSFPDISRMTYSGLPGMLSESLPDHFGHKIIDVWLAKTGRSLEDWNSVEKLSYIGKRGMGALEYSPTLTGKLDESVAVDMKELVELTIEVLERHSKDKYKISDLHDELLLDLLRVGGSAGGSRPIGLIAIDEKTNEIRSGQGNVPDGYKHWIIKIDLSAVGAPAKGSIEYAYNKMALAAGIKISECRLLDVNGAMNFISQRFDRPSKNRKLHLQSLSSLAHFDHNHAGQYSYEDCFDIMRRLNLPSQDFEQQYRRMVFNIIARNLDDHTKNIAFLMDDKGVWKLAPAHDVTHMYNPGDRYLSSHQMTINGKRIDHTREDLINIGLQLRLSNCEVIISEIVQAVSEWDKYASMAGVSKETAKHISSNHLLSI